MTKEIGVAVIYNAQGEILIDRRLEAGQFGGFWEFPGGKIEAGETIQECIEREILEELGIKISPKEYLLSLEHQYPNLRVILHAYSCRYLGGEPQTLQCQEIRWVKPEDLGNYHFPEANQQIIAAIQTLIMGEF
jgi:mutator protein MutT